jgi:hypothetical protein
MDTNHMTDEEVVLAAKALSIHRASQRRKLDRLREGTAEYRTTLDEIGQTQRLVNKLNAVDLQRLGQAS